MLSKYEKLKQTVDKIDTAIKYIPLFQNYQNEHLDTESKFKYNIKKYKGVSVGNGNLYLSNRKNFNNWKDCFDYVFCTINKIDPNNIDLYKESSNMLYRTYKALYKDIVVYLTKLNDLSVLDNFDEWNKGYNLDHKISIKYGYIHNVSPELISDIRNLRFISKKENLYKNWSCYIDELNKDFI